MNYQELPVPLKRFVDRVGVLLESELEEAQILPEVGQALRQLIENDHWLARPFTQQHPDYYQQHLLYAEPEDRFSVVSFVWGPGQKTPVHNHTVWGVIGMLRGSEFDQKYEPADDGLSLVKTDEVQLLPGDIGYVSPSIGDVHAVRNAYDDQVSISIHVYGGNIGKIKRNVFYPASGENKEFISGYANANE